MLACLSAGPIGGATHVLKQRVDMSNLFGKALLICITLSIGIVFLIFPKIVQKIAVDTVRRGSGKSFSVSNRIYAIGFMDSTCKSGWVNIVGDVNIGA
jgi:hypothetical protein